MLQATGNIVSRHMKDAANECKKIHNDATREFKKIHN